MFFVLRMSVEIGKRLMKVKGHKDIWKSCFVSIFVHFVTKKRFEKKRYGVSLLLLYFVRILYAFFRLHCRHEFSIGTKMGQLMFFRCVCVQNFSSKGA